MTMDDELNREHGIRFVHLSDGFEGLLIGSLVRWTEEGDRRQDLRSQRSLFHGRRAPPIGVEDYVLRIMKYAGCSPACFSVAYAYMRRMAAAYTDLIPTEMNVHRILLACVVMAIKANEDVHYDNAHFSKVGGLGLAEMNRLESELLQRMKFAVQVSVEEMVRAESVMVRYAIVPRNVTDPREGMKVTGRPQFVPRGPTRIPGMAPSPFLQQKEEKSSSSVLMKHQPINDSVRIVVQ